MANIGDSIKVNWGMNYHFNDNKVVDLNGVKELVIRDSGTHRLKTSDNKLHIIPNKWKYITILGGVGSFQDVANLTAVNERSRTYKFEDDSTFVIENITSFGVFGPGYHIIQQGLKYFIIANKWLHIEIDATDWTL